MDQGKEIQLATMQILRKYQVIELLNTLKYVFICLCVGVRLCSEAKEGSQFGEANQTARKVFYGKKLNPMEDS